MPREIPAKELTAFEDALRQLTPREATLDRDALFFQAGQASGPRRWPWPALAVSSSITAMILAVLLAVRPPPQVTERVVHVPVEQAPAPSLAPSSPEVADPPFAVAPQRHRQLQEHLLRWGLEGLGDPPAGDPHPRRKHDVFTHYSQLSTGEILP